MEYFLIWFALSVLFLMFMKGATKKGNLFEDPHYYD